MESSRFWIYLVLLAIPLPTVTRASDENDVGEPAGTEDEQNAMDETIEQVPVENLVDMICDCRAKDACEVKNGPRDCYDIQKLGKNNSGLYDIYPAYVEGPIQVYCDMDTAGGGWTVFQRREDGLVDFFRNYEDYENGFGYAGSEFWLGNKNIFALSNQDPYELRIDLQDFEGKSRYAHYNHFRIGDGSTNYKLAIGAYDGDAGDSLTYHNGQDFSAKDQDNDSSSSNCAENHKGGWWYKACHNSNLNGLYLAGATEEHAISVTWQAWKGHNYSLKRTEMKMRPVNA